MGPYFGCNLVVSLGVLRTRGPYQGTIGSTLDMRTQIHSPIQQPSSILLGAMVCVSGSRPIHTQVVAPKGTIDKTVPHIIAKPRIILGLGSRGYTALCKAVVRPAYGSTAGR